METTMNLETPVTLKMVNAMSEDEFFQFCQINDTLEFERDSQGNIIVMSPAGAFTGSFNFRIAGLFFIWNEEAKLGEAFDSSAGFTLANGAVRSPDLSWIKKERWDQISEWEQEKFTRICPDFVIEIRSRSDSINYLLEKMQEYIDNGVRLGWLIDRFDNKVYIYNTNKEVTVLNSVRVTLSGEDVLPGFELNLAAILK